MIVVDIGAGVALTLFGVRFLRKGLDRLFGGKLVPWIAATTKDRWRGFGAGIVAGTVAPSSTTMSLMAVQLLHLGKFGPDRLLALLLGAGVGITVMVQLLAFKITDHVGWFLVLGVLLFQFFKRPILRGIGQCLLSLGFIFLAMRIIGSAAREISGSQDVVQLFAILEGNPLVLLMGTAILAFVMQSSTASIAFGLALSMGGIVSPLMMVPWVLGTNIGLAATSLVAGWRDLDSRRLGTANFLLKLSGGLPLALIPGLGIAMFEIMPGDFARQVAMFHTGFNLLVGLLALPFLAHICAMVGWMVSPEQGQSEPEAPESYLDRSALETPSLAIAQATRETLRMGDQLRWMLVAFQDAFRRSDKELLFRIRERDNVVDGINLSIAEYLGSLDEGMSAEDARWQLALLSFSNELESVGDIIDKHLVDLLVKRVDRVEQLPPEEVTVVEELFSRVLTRFDEAIALLTTRNAAASLRFLEGKEILNAWCRDAQTAHFQRLTQASGKGSFTSLLFLELLNGLRRINSHISTIGYTLSLHGRSPRKRRRE